MSIIQETIKLPCPRGFDTLPDMVFKNGGGWTLWIFLFKWVLRGVHMNVNVCQPICQIHSDKFILQEM